MSEGVVVVQLFGLSANSWS